MHDAELPPVDIGCARRRGWAPAALAFLLPLVAASLFQLVLPAEYRVNESPDYLDFYYPVAERLVDGHGLTTRDGRLADRYPPGYPLIIATVITGAEATGIEPDSTMRVVSVVFHGVATLLLFGIALTFVRPWIACAGALAWGLSPVALWLTKQPNSELAFSVIVLAALLVFVRMLEDRTGADGLRLAAVGALLGVATLVRPIAIGIVVPLAVVYVLARRAERGRRVALGLGTLCLVFSVVLLPWELHVYDQSSEVIPVSTNGVQAVVDGLTFGTGPAHPGGAGVPADVGELMEQIEQDRAELGSIGEIASSMGDHLARTPSPVVQLLGIKTARSWFATDSGRHEPLLLAFQIPYLAVALAGLVRTWRHGSRDWVRLVALLVGYFWIMTIAALSIVRYMTVPEALLAPFFVLGLQGVLARLVRRPGRAARIPWLVALTRDPWRRPAAAGARVSPAPALG